MYATVKDFVLRIGEFQAIQLTDRDREGVVNESVLTIALSDSTSQIDGYLSARYRLPLPTIPQNLTRICCDLTRYRLASMSQVGNTDELSLKELEDLAAGKISLGIDIEDDQQSDGNVVMFTNPNNRIFGRDNRN